MNYDAARLALRRALAAKGWNPADLSRAAGVDQGTVLDFLNGNRTPQIKTRGRMEQAVGWPAGTLDDIAAGHEPPLVELDEQDDEQDGGRHLTVAPDVPPENPVLEAIRNDPHLLPEAKEHLLNQYGLLLRVAALSEESARLPHVARRSSDAPAAPADPAEEARILEDVERAARANPRGPRGRGPRTR